MSQGVRKPTVRPDGTGGACNEGQQLGEEVEWAVLIPAP